jgi:hypothetical protein
MIWSGHKNSTDIKRTIYKKARENFSRAKVTLIVYQTLMVVIGYQPCKAVRNGSSRY